MCWMKCYFIKFIKWGMHLTQPTTRYSIWSWKSQDIPFLALIILEHSRSLMIGLVVKNPALIILLNFDGLKAFIAHAVDLSRKSHLLLRGVSFFAENVKSKHPLRRGHCFIGPTNHFGYGFLLCGL